MHRPPSQTRPGCPKLDFDQSTEAQQSPSAVLAQFVALQTEGKGLKAEGQKDLDALLVEPPRGAVTKSTLQGIFSSAARFSRGTKATFTSSTSHRVTWIPHCVSQMESPAESKCARAYSLALSNKYLLPRRGGKPAQEFAGPNRWKITAAPSELWISVNTAIPYVTDMRDKTADPVIKQNAKQTLVELRSLQ